MILPLFTYLVLRSPAFQTYITGKAAAYLSKELKTEVKVGGVDISWFMKVVLEDVTIKDLHHNYLLKVHRLEAGISGLSRKKRIITLHEISLQDAQINLANYKTDSVINLQFIISYLSSNDTTKKTSEGGKGWIIRCPEIIIKNTRFTFRNEHKITIDSIKGINFNDLNIIIHDADFARFSIKGDTISSMIKTLVFEEKSGFNVYRFSSDFSISSRYLIAKNLKIITSNSDLDLDLGFFYKSFQSYADFLNKVEIHSLIRYSKLDITDIAYFAHPLFSMPNKIKLATEISGPVSNIKLKNFYVEFGRKGMLHANVYLRGLPDVERTFIQVSIARLEADKADIEAIRIPNQLLKLPEQISPLGNISLKGYFSGYYDRFKSKIEARTQIGFVTADLDMNTDKKSRVTSYTGNVSTMNFNLGKMFMLSDLGNVSMQASIDGSGMKPENASLYIKGKVDTLFYRNYHYKNILINGDYKRKAFNGEIGMNDQNLNFKLNGKLDFSTDVPMYNFTAAIHTFNPNSLHLIRSDSIFKLKGNVTIDLTGSDADNINGSLKITDFILTENNSILPFKQLELNSILSTNWSRSIILNTDYIDADISGNFKLNKLTDLIGGFIRTYIPSITLDTSKYHVVQNMENQNISFNFKLKNINPALKLFLPVLDISKNSFIEGGYNSESGRWTIAGSASEIIISGLRLGNWNLKGFTKDKTLFIETGADHFKLSDSIGIDRLHLAASVGNDSILYNIRWMQDDTRKIKNNGDVKGLLSFVNKPYTENYIFHSRATINDTLWTIDEGNMVRIDSNKIQIDKLSFTNNLQNLLVNGTVSATKGDQLKVAFRNFNISVFNVFTKKSGLNFGGFINGDVILYNLYKDPNFFTDLKILDLSINNDKVGDAYVNTSWNEAKKGLYIKTDIIYTGNKGKNTPVSVEGFYYPVKNKENNNFDLKIDITALKVQLFSGFLSSFCTLDNRGKATGTLYLTGASDAPDLTGKLSLQGVKIKINYLNTEYTFGHEMLFEKDGFSFKDLVLNDPQGRQALFNGKIYHNHFKDIRLDLDINPKNLLLLNTSSAQNETFYGKAYATGRVKIHGPANNLVFDIDAKTEPNTKLFIPISSNTSVSENYFVKFVQKKDTIIEPEKNDQELSGISLNFNFNVTPDATIQIDLNYEAGGIIKANGSGNIKLGIDTKGTFKIFGDYIIDDGSYFLNLENLFNKSFKIDKGSSIKWNGNMTGAMVDINAVYRTRASLYDLRNNPLLVTPDTSRKRVPVDCIIHLKDNLLNPTVSFEIDFPTLPEMLKEQYVTVVNSNLNFQFLSLLVLGQFIDNNPDKSNYTDRSGSSTNVGANAAEALSNQLSSWLSKISKNFDIGVKYRPGTQVSKDELEVALATQLLNDRLLIDGNIGMGGAQKNSSTQSSSNIVGDVNIEYKVTNDGAFRVKAFNRSNNNTYTINDAPYTQGIGVFYRREFENLKELFTIKKKKKKK